MGTHGRRGLARLVLGSNAEYVLRHTQVPVLLVRNHPKD
jgi:nucleotide-binding universal stress UspA family protein